MGIMRLAKSSLYYIFQTNEIEIDWVYPFQFGMNIEKQQQNERKMKMQNQ